MSLFFRPGQTSQSVIFFLQDSSSTVGAGLTGMAYNTSGLEAWYKIGATGALTQITLQSLASDESSWTSGGFVEIDSTSAPGGYRLDMPNVAVASEEYVSLLMRGATNLADTWIRLECRLFPSDLRVIQGDAQSVTDLKDFADAGYDPATNYITGIAGTINTLDGLDTAQDTQHATTQAAVAAVGVASGTGLNYEATDDNTGGAIKSVTFVGTETSGTFASTEAEDGTYHQIDDATDAIDIVYQFEVGGIRRAVQAIWKGYVSGSNDTITVQAYDFVGADWGTRTTITGQAGTDNINIPISLLQKHTGTGTDSGLVLLRFVCSGQSNPTLYTDELLVEAAIANQSVGYANGAIWVDTNASNTNTTDFVDGTADNPVSTWAAAEALATSLGITRFELAPGSSITLDANSDNFQINAPGSTVALGGQSVSGTVIKGATISGNDDGSNSNPTSYFDCLMGSNTLGLHKLKQCGLSGTITLAEAGTYDWTFCYPEVAGTGTPAVDVGTAVANTNLNIRSYSGGIELQQMGDTGTDNVSLEGNGQLVINANCSGGTVVVRGNFRITDNSGSVNLVTTIPTVDQVHSGTAQTGTANTVTLAASASSTDGQYDPGSITIIAGTGAGQARNIIDYNGTTKVATIDKDWRTNPDSTSSYVITTNPGQLHVNEGLAQGGASTSITLNSAASATDDVYIGQTVFITAGTGQDQARIVTDYNGTTKVATVHKAWATNPTSASSYVMLPLPAIGDSVVNIETDTNELQTNQGNWLTATGFSTHSAADVRTEMDSNSTQLAAIVADTNELQTNQGNWITADVSALATAAALATVDANVDAILVDTGTTIPATLTTILADTNELQTNQGSWITADVSGLATSAALATVDANVDAILVDTGTTIPAQITALNNLSAQQVWEYNFGNSRTPEQALAFLRNKWVISSGTLTVYDTDDTTALWSAATTQTAGDPTSAVDPA